MVDLEIIDAQLWAFVFMWSINGLAVFRKRLNDLKGFSQNISISPTPPTPFVRAAQIKVIIKNGMKVLPTKNELMLTPIVNTNYIELFA